MMRDIATREGLADRLIIDSAGTAGYHVGELPDRRMRVHAHQRGIDLTHRCRRVSESDFERFDIIVGMDHSNLSDLRRIAPTPEAVRKIVPMASFFPPGESYDHVPDPYYEGAEGFELVLDLLTEGCRRMLDTLLTQKS